MRKKVHLLSGVAALTIMAMTSGPAIAQDAAGIPETQSEAAPAASREDGRIVDVVVTARRRSESAQTVPVAVSVATSAQLEQHQVLNGYQLVNLTPSLQVQSQTQQAGAVNFAIRGVGTNIYGSQIESSVGIVVDDIVMSRPQFGNVQFFDLDRVEVLRGPQGMLFGKNAAAGLINITTSQPRLGRTEFLANAQYGNTSASGSGNVASLQVAGNAPIGSKAALRVSAFVTRQDGFVRDVKLDQNLGNTAAGGRVKLLWEPSDSVRLTFASDYQHSRGPGEGVLVRSFTAPGGLIATIDASNGVSASRKNNLLATDIADTDKSEVYGASFKAEIELGGGYTLTNVFGHRRYKANNSLDTDTTTTDLFNVNRKGFRYRQTTDELRLSSPTTGPFSFQAGLFYLDLYAREYILQGADLQGSNLPAVGLPSTPPLPPGFSYLGGYQDDRSPTKSYAAFFEGQYKITDSLRFTAGGRYTHDEIGVDYLASNPAALVPLNAPLSFFKTVKKDNLSYRAGLDFTVAPAVLTYFTYAKGYKGPTVGNHGEIVQPEIPESFELGVKSTLFDRRLRLNVALFDTTFNGFQTQAQRPGDLSFITLNAGQLKTRGVEVEFTAVPVEGLTISGGTTYNDTKYKNLPGIPCYYGQPTGTSGTNVCLPTGSQNVSGNQLAVAPRWTTTATVRYEHPVLSGWTGFVQGDVYHRSSFNFTQSVDPRTRLGPNAIFGLSAGVKAADDRITITAFVRNLFDKRVPTYLFADPVAPFYVNSAGVPDSAHGGDYWQNFGPNSYRTIGVAMSFRL